MRVVRRALCVIALLTLQIVIVITPGFEPDARAQVTCSASLEAQLATCINGYNNATSNTTIRLLDNIALTADLPVINNTAASPPELTIDGQGWTLDGDGAAFDILEQDAGDTVITNITLADGISSGAQNDGGTMTVTNSTITGNGSNGVYANTPDGTTVINSTIVANREGVLVGSSDVATVLSSSIVANFETGIDLPGILSIGGSLIATNTDSNCNLSITADLTDLGGNRTDGIDCTLALSLSLPGTFSTTLADNGCATPCTQTLELFGNSPAVNGDPGCAGGLTDQRGVVRVAGLCDVGAFEAGDCAAAATTVTTQGEFADAINCYNTQSVPTSILMGNDILLTSSLPAIDNNSWPPQLVIDGQGHTLDGGNSVLDLLAQTDGDSLITNMTLTRAASTAVQHDGGSLEITNSTLTNSLDNAVFANAANQTVVKNSTIANNIRGVVASLSGSARVQSSTIVGNQFGYQSDGTVHSAGSLIAGQTTADCAITTFVDDGGNVYGDTSCTGTATPGLLGSFELLADNGCTAPCTQTIALLPGSPAIDFDVDCGGGLFDQRGVVRTNNQCDAGAFEIGIATSLLCNGLAVTIDMNSGATGFGTGGDDVIFGTPGPDVIDGMGGDDTICGEGGDDNISGSAGVDFLYGGDGDDTLNGGDGNDRIRGQKGIDTINGGDGNDFLYGGVEGDMINGGDGRDTIGGFGGADTIDGGPGNDNIFGGFGADTIHGGDGNDKILGLVGNDIINGDAGNDTLNGDNGQDTINGGADNDVIKGGNSVDTLSGDDGDDSVNGGKSNDALSGGNGNDTCVGNTGTDTADATCETIFGVP